MLRHGCTLIRPPAFRPHSRTIFRPYSMIASDWNQVSNDKSPPYFVYAKPIQKSQQDDRDYRLIRLENGLHAMLVHDAKADKAAASLDVAVGHLHDPDDMPGLAHFCEHLSFMGTEQYPRENEYSEFLAKNNGSSNAFTGTTNTNYFFSVATPALVPALSRFAAFFHSPLFSPSCTTRELNAVDSEHKKNLQADMWRIFQLNKHLSADGHVWKKFGSGNKQSLSQAGKDLRSQMKLNSRLDGTASSSSSLASSPIPSRMASPAPSTSSTNSEADDEGGFVGRETRRRLMEWWTKEYCASRMRLCIIGKEPLDELAGMASSLFSPVKNRGQDPAPMINEHPFGPNEKGTLVSVQTIMSFHAVEISFPSDYQPPFWRRKPARFVCHFVGHEGPGSLHSYLKSKGWITILSAGPQGLGRGFAMFKITIHLTDAGFRNYRSVMLAAFKYLSLLRSSSFPAWYQQEQVALARTRFRFTERRRPEDYAVWVAEHMVWPAPPEFYISGPQLVWEWNEDGNEGIGEKEVRDMLDGFRVDQGRAVLMARAEEQNKLFGTSVQWETEPWYGTVYRVERFDDDFVKQAQGSNDIPELFLPGHNEFIPTNLDVEKQDVTEPLKRPFLIRKSSLSTLWHKKDDRFWVPKGHVRLQIHTPLANDTPRNAVLTKLFHDLVTDSLTEYAYDAELAGLAYVLYSDERGLAMSLAGYNDKIAVLARHVVQRLKDLVVNQERLEVMKEAYKKDLENFFLGKPYYISDYHGRYLLTEKQWTVEEVLPEIPSVTADDVQKHAKELLAKVKLSMLVAGNISKGEAVSIAEMVENILASSPLPSPVFDRALILPEGCNFVWTTPVPNRAEPNSSLTYYMHVGRLTYRHTRVAMALLAQILTEPAFNVLRTKEQLGYVVLCSSWVLAGSGDGGIRVSIQSERDPQYLEARVEAFLDSMKTVIEAMGPKEFEEQKFGLERKWREELKQLAEEIARYWHYIDTGHLDFFRREQDADLLKNITKQDILSLFLSRIHPSSATRSKLSVHLRSQKPPPPKLSAAAVEAFEASLGKPELRGSWKEVHGDDSTPHMEQFESFWKSQGVDSVLLASIPDLAKKYPLEDKVLPREGVTYIEDVKAFKKSLQISEETRPSVEWGDVPLSKY